MRNKISVGVLLSLILLVFMLSGNAQAVVIYDTYYGADDHGYGDVIGSTANFDVEYMDVQIDAITNKLAVQIKTNYRGNDYDGFSNLNTDFGDLFISTDGWNPDMSQPNYLADNFNSVFSEDWEYAFDVSAGKLYQITDSNIRLSDQEMPTSGWVYRNGQEVLIDPTGLSSSLNGTAMYDNGFYSLSIDITGLGWILADLGFHWTMTCGNDVIEGIAPGGDRPPVPEPATMILLGSGLLGFAGLGRKKLLKK